MRELPSEDVSTLLKHYGVMPEGSDSFLVSVALLQELVRAGYRLGLDAEVMKVTTKETKT